MPDMQAAAPIGQTMAPKDQCNPMNARIAAHTISTPSLAESIAFFDEMFGCSIEGRFSYQPEGAAASRAVCVLKHRAVDGPRIRLIEVPPGAPQIRPRPDTRPWDPGLSVIECLTRDPAESYHRLASAHTPMVSPPRYYWFRNITMGRDLDVMSYSPFGPASEQFFVTCNIRNDRPDWGHDELHGPFIGAVIVGLDQRPIAAFYEQAFGLLRTSLMDCAQRNTNELIGAPVGTYFQWGFLGDQVAIEVEEFHVPSGVMRPTSLDGAGLAMFTLCVDDLAAAKRRVESAGIPLEADHALPLLDGAGAEGFRIRGAVGELVEVIGR